MELYQQTWKTAQRAVKTDFRGVCRLSKQERAQKEASRRDAGRLLLSFMKLFRCTACDLLFLERSRHAEQTA